MHRTALGALCIDVSSTDVGPASAFWQAALGRTSRHGTSHPEFQVLSGRFDSVTGIIQDVGTTAPGLHLDLHTDDVEAEVARLVALGATEVERHGGWVVLEDPARLRFCIVPVDADDPVLTDAPAYE